MTLGTALLRRRNSQANPLMWRVGGEVTQRIANPYTKVGVTHCNHKQIRSLPFWKTARTDRELIGNLGTGESRHD